jgi:hypothetical protein
VINWQVKLSIKEKLAGPGGWRGRENLALVGSKRERERGREGEGEAGRNCHMVLGFRMRAALKAWI